MKRVFLLFIFLTFPVWAQQFPFDYELYNQLSGPSFATKRLENNGKFEDFLNEAKSIYEEYKVADKMGFRLLHRHFSIKNGQRMVEIYDEDWGRPNYLTEITAEVDTPQAVAASFICTKGGIYVFEYTDDRLAGAVLKDLNKNFFSDVTKLLNKYALEEIISPTILSRSTSHHFDESKPLVEVSKWGEGSRITSASRIPERSIPTAWSFNSKSNTYCELLYCHYNEDDDPYCDFHITKY